MGSVAKAVKKVTKVVKKPISKITKGIAKGIVKVGKATMRGVAKIQNKLGPLGSIAMAIAIEPNGPSLFCILATPRIVAFPTLTMPLAIPLVILLIGFLTTLVTFFTAFATLPICYPYVVLIVFQMSIP